MPPTSPSKHRSIRAAHPLATALIECLQSGARVLEIGTGNRRNADALKACGFQVESVDTGALENQTGTFNAALSTHGLLHGTPRDVADAIAHVASLLEKDAPLFATFGSTADRRYAQGEKVDEDAYAEETGDERGVTHAFFDAVRLRDLLAPNFETISMTEMHVDDIAGRWAHPTQPLRGAVHWFVIARRARLATH